MILITGLCVSAFTRDLKVENISKRQAMAEMLVEQAQKFVRNNTGGTKFDNLIPFGGSFVYDQCSFQSYQPYRSEKPLQLIFPQKQPGQW